MYAVKFIPLAPFSPPSLSLSLSTSSHHLPLQRPVKAHTLDPPPLSSRPHLRRLRLGCPTRKLLSIVVLEAQGARLSAESSEQGPRLYQEYHGTEPGRSRSLSRCVVAPLCPRASGSAKRSESRHGLGSSCVGRARGWRVKDLEKAKDLFNVPRVLLNLSQPAVSPGHLLSLARAHITCAHRAPPAVSVPGIASQAHRRTTMRCVRTNASAYATYWA
eukprot:1465069-Rhodomonas_salina.2